jgi:type IV secretion system protein VirD4
MNKKIIEKIIRLESIMRGTNDDDFKVIVNEKIARLKNKYNISDVAVRTVKGEQRKITSAKTRKVTVTEQLKQHMLYFSLRMQRLFRKPLVRKGMLTFTITTAFYCLIVYIVNFLINMVQLGLSYLNNKGVDISLWDWLNVSLFNISSVPWFVNLIIFIIIGIIVILKIIIPLYRWKKSAVEKKSLKGSAAWEELEQQEQLFTKVSIDKPEQSLVAGVPVDFKQGSFYCVKEFLNSVILGSTRSGKSQGYVLPMIHLFSGVQEKENMIITDPKGELHEATHTMLVERGYDVLVVDLVLPERGNKWQMIQTIQALYYEHTEQSIERAITGIKNISFILYQEDGEKDPLWKNAAKELFNSSLLYYLEDCYNYFTESEVKKLALARMQSESEYVRLSEKYRKAHRARFTMSGYTEFMNKVTKTDPQKKRMVYDLLIDERKAHEQVVRLYATTYSAEGKTKASILTTFFAELGMFQEPSIQKFMTENEVDYQRFLTDKPVALFLKIPDYMKTRHKIATICIEQMYQQLVEHMAIKLIDKLPRKLNFLLDEIGNMPALDDLDNRLNVCLGRNIRYHLLLQDYDQLEKIYGEVMKRLIISACGIKTYIQTTSLESNKYFSELLGNKTVKVLNHNGHLTNPLLANINEEVAERALLNPQELEKLGKWEIVTKIQRVNPIIGKIMPAFTSDYLQEKYQPQVNMSEAREVKDIDEVKVFNEGDDETYYDEQELNYLYKVNKITYEEYKQRKGLIGLSEKNKQ